MKTGGIPILKGRPKMGGTGEKPRAIPGPNVGDSIPAKPKGLGPNHVHGSYSKGPKVGTRMAK